MKESCLEPVHYEGWDDLRRVGPQAMQMVLIQTAVNLILPESRPTDLAALAKQKIALLECELGYFVWVEVHLIQGGEVQAAPENICGTEERTWGESRACRRRESLSLLDFEDVTDPPHAPARRQAADLSRNELLGDSR